MAIQDLKSNIQQEKKLAIELNQLLLLFYNARLKRNSNEERLLKNSIYSIINQIKILNNCIPALLGNISMIKKLSTGLSQVAPKNIEEKLTSLSYSDSPEESKITIQKSDKETFLDELKIKEYSLKKLKKERIERGEKTDFKKPNFYAKLSNRFFSEFAISLINKGYFKSLSLDLRKANFSTTFSTFISIMFFSTLLSFFASIFIFTFFLFFQFSGFSLTLAEGPILTRLIKIFWIIFIIPTAVFFLLYYYPISEKKSISKKIEQELPFVTLHMSAIASSGIEPSNIFKIIAISKEYPSTQKEAKKLMNQINIYGYDIVTALRNLASATSSKKLSELFSGLATTISSGGSLTEFLNKRAETLLFEYKLEREKYTRMAETFMDIYISVVIAAPMILMLLLVMINITGISIGLTLDMLTILIILIIALVNVLFIVFLNLKQPGY